MAYKIANIKWLRDQGWSISSSYASGFCPTYNEIVNEIPKDSTTVNVNGTCIATSKAYANNQLVCESDITIEPAVDCSVYQFSSIETPLETHTTTSIAYSLRSLEALTYTIKSSGGFLTGITVVGTSDRWEYMGEFNRTESLYNRTATIEYKNGDGTCVFQQQLVMKGNEEYTVFVKPYYNESSCARVLIADGGPIEFTLRFSIGSSYTLTYTVPNGEKFGETQENFGNIIVPFGDVSSFRFNYLSTNEGNILKASTSSNGNKLPKLNTTWAYGDSKAMWDGIIPPLCDDSSSSNGNRFVVSWDIDTANKTITIYYMYENLVG